MSGLVYAPSKHGWRVVTFEDALVSLLRSSRSLAYLERQIDVCRIALRLDRCDEHCIRILGEKAADYAQQLLDERYGAVPALMDDPFASAGVRV